MPQRAAAAGRVQLAAARRRGEDDDAAARNAEDLRKVCEISQSPKAADVVVGVDVAIGVLEDEDDCAPVSSSSSPSFVSRLLCLAACF